MSQNLSEIKKVSFSLLQKIDILAKPRINNPVVNWFWNKFFISHGKTTILETPDEELKKMLLECYSEIDGIVKKLETAIELKTELNSEFSGTVRTDGTKKNSVRDLPAFKELMDLVE